MNMGLQIHFNSNCADSVSIVSSIYGIGVYFHFFAELKPVGMPAWSRDRRFFFPVCKDFVVHLVRMNLIETVISSARKLHL